MGQAGPSPRVLKRSCPRHPPLEGGGCGSCEIFFGKLQDLIGLFPVCLEVNLHLLGGEHEPILFPPELFLSLKHYILFEFMMLLAFKGLESVCSLFLASMPPSSCLHLSGRTDGRRGKECCGHHRHPGGGRPQAGRPGFFPSKSTPVLRWLGVFRPTVSWRLFLSLWNPFYR